MYINNKNLITIKDDFKGNEIINNEFVMLRSNNKPIYDLLKWKFSKNPQHLKKKSEKYNVKVIQNNKLLSTKKDYLSWLGHASFLIQLNNKKIILDPCLTNPPFTKRYTKLPINIKEIKPNYLLISHGHFDHLDKNTIKHFDNSTALIPLKMSSIINSANKSITTQEASWYQKYNIHEEFEIYFLPSYHWHKRTITDTNKVLWGSYIIKSKNTTIYFAGDTAYSSHFKDIGKLFDIDIAILPIGAYAPRWFMKDNHINPQEALMAFKDLNAKQFIPMHYGTFDLTNEPRGEPESILKEISKNYNIKFTNIGEIIYL